jgi:hypothetical protein
MNIVPKVDPQPKQPLSLIRVTAVTDLSLRRRRQLDFVVLAPTFKDAVQILKADVPAVAEDPAFRFSVETVENDKFRVATERTRIDDSPIFRPAEPLGAERLFVVRTQWMDRYVVMASDFDEAARAAKVEVHNVQEFPGRVYQCDEFVEDPEFESGVYMVGSQATSLLNTMSWKSTQHALTGDARKDRRLRALIQEGFVEPVEGTPTTFVISERGRRFLLSVAGKAVDAV